MTNRASRRSPFAASSSARACSTVIDSRFCLLGLIPTGMSASRATFFSTSSAAIARSRHSASWPRVSFDGGPRPAALGHVAESVLDVARRDRPQLLRPESVDDRRHRVALVDPRALGEVARFDVGPEPFEPEVDPLGQRDLPGHRRGRVGPELGHGLALAGGAEPLGLAVGQRDAGAPASGGLLEVEPSLPRRLGGVASASSGLPSVGACGSPGLAAQGYHLHLLATSQSQASLHSPWSEAVYEPRPLRWGSRGRGFKSRQPDALTRGYAPDMR